jgi:DNA-binding LytR/AlgR family response regulator
LVKLRCLIIDDEPLAREGVKGFIHRTPFLEFTAMAVNAFEASGVLARQKIDLIFLDIDMPVKDGISFLKELPVKINTIIVTAYPQFAVEGFELNVIDYLLKPVSYDRFTKAVNKVRSIINSSPKDEDKTHIFIKSGREYKKILIADIDYLESKGNYLVIYTSQQSFLTYLSLKKAEELLPPDIFIKVHKSFIINGLKITRIEGNHLIIYNKAIPMSRNLKEDVTARLFRNKKMW